MKNYPLKNIPQTLYNKISELAKKEERSINKQIIFLLKKAVE